MKDDNCLFSMSYNSCLETVGLQIYKKNTYDGDNTRDLYDIEDDSSVDSGVRLLQKWMQYITPVWG